MTIEIAILIVFILEFLIGYMLFGKIFLNGNIKDFSDKKVSVIIPARNEESNLPFILNSLSHQTYTPYEIIVVDDFSSDKTVEVANSFGVKVIKNTELPGGWTGKSWALNNGYIESSGEIIVFLDADVRLASNGLEVLLKNREKTGGVISVIPFHYTEKFYERFAMLPNILGIFAFTSLFERIGSKKALYGSCIVTTRDDYDKIKGHSSVKSEVIDDISLGKIYSEAGIKIENFIGTDFVSFRMYPAGLKGEIEGFAKSALLSTATLRAITTIFIAIWIIGLLASEFVTPFLLIFNNQLGFVFLTGYLIYTIQILYFVLHTGRFGIIIPLFHFISSIFFIIIITYSAFMVKILGRVSWKGRQINVGGRNKP